MNLIPSKPLPRSGWLGFLFGSNIYLKLCLLLFGLGILLLPISSFPLLIRISGASSVAPLSNLIFLLLVFIWIIPYLWGGGRVPLEGFLLLLFISLVVFTWGAAFFLEIPPFRDVSIVSQGRSAFLTLIMAACAFFVPA
ncbi:MAG: hypothetical protein ACNA8H_10485, partial [Anaerolineales bacterium]